MLQVKLKLDGIGFGSSKKSYVVLFVKKRKDGARLLMRRTRGTMFLFFSLVVYWHGQNVLLFTVSVKFLKTGLHTKYSNLV